MIKKEKNAYKGGLNLGPLSCLPNKTTTLSTTDLVKSNYFPQTR